MSRTWMRTWMLETEEYAEGKWDWLVCRKAAEKRERVEVFEAAPVLDLLERWYNTRPLRRIGNIEGQRVDAETAALLATHGRLSDVVSEEPGLKWGES